MSTSPTTTPRKKPKTEPSFVWFALWRGNDGFIVQAEKLDSKGLDNIAQLKHAVQRRVEPKLDDLAAGELKVYEPQTVKGEEDRLRDEQFGKELHAGDDIPGTPDDSKLLILIVAPKKETPDQASSNGGHKLQQQRLPIMSSSSVWVQLYLKGENEPKGRPISVKKAKDVEESEWNIDALAKATKAKLKPKIDNVGNHEIFVYPPGTKPPFSEQTFIRPDKKLHELIDELGNKNPPKSITSRHPLIVVAPKKETPDLTTPATPTTPRTASSDRGRKQQQHLPIMSSSSIWVQLYYKGENEPKGLPVEIEPLPRNVGALAKAVKVESPNGLGHCDAADLDVYPPGTKPPFSEQTSFRGDKKLHELIDELGNKNPPVSIASRHPLIVVAPKKGNPYLANNHGNDDRNTNEPLPKKVWFAESFVWFALWRDNDFIVEAEELDSTGLYNIAKLRRAVYKELYNTLQDIAPGALKVYEPQTVKGEEDRLRNGQFGKELDAEDDVPGTTDDSKLLILVVAPKKENPVVTLNLLADQPAGDAIQALAHYREIGKKIREKYPTNSQYNLHDQLKDLNENLGCVDFAVLDGPSGIGKTQYSFSLEEATTRLFVLSGGSESTQAIYQNFKGISRHFIEAVKRDKAKVKSRAHENDKEWLAYFDLKYGLSLRKSHTAGFLKTVFALKHYPEDLVQLNGTTIEPLSYSDFWKSCEGYKDYIVVLDEVGSWATDLKLLKFTRNLLRSLRLRVLLMGTNASASTLDDQLNNPNMRLSGEVSRMCRVLTDCPKFIGDAEVQIGPIQVKTELLGRPLLVELVQHHRQACSEGISPAKALDCLFEKVADDLMTRKPAAWEDGRLGQLCMFHPGYYCANKDFFPELSCKYAFDEVSVLDPIVSRLVVSHFPHLVHQFRDGSLSYSNLETRFVDLGGMWELVNVDTRQEWCPVCEFKAGDIFLFFVLSRWATCFLDGGRRVSTFSLYQLLRPDAPKCVATFPDVSNPKARKASGDALEGFAAVAFTLASHIDGVGGCSLEMFILAFVSELHPSTSPRPLEYAANNRGDTRTVLGIIDEVFDDGEKVPYLGPTNAEIPVDWCRWDGVRFGSARRPADREGVDLVVTQCGQDLEFMACECKDSKVTGKVLEDVMKRVKPEWKVHFLVCSSHPKLRIASVKKAMAHTDHRYLVEATVKESVVSFKILYSPPQGTTQACKLSVIIDYGTTGVQEVSTTPDVELERHADTSTGKLLVW